MDLQALSLVRELLCLKIVLLDVQALRLIRELLRLKIVLSDMQAFRLSRELLRLRIVLLEVHAFRLIQTGVLTDLFLENTPTTLRLDNTRRITNNNTTSTPQEFLAGVPYQQCHRRQNPTKTPPPIHNKISEQV